MVKTNDYDNRNDRAAALLEEAIKNLGPELIANPQLAEILNRKIDDQLNEYYINQNGKGAPADGGLADLIGLGKDAPTNLGDTQISRGVVDYDDTVTSDRILAFADLYYIWALLNPSMIRPHPARSFGSGSPLPSLGEGLGERAKSMIHTSIQQRLMED